MKLATVVIKGQEVACIRTEWGFIPLTRINQRLGIGWPEDTLTILCDGLLNEIKSWYDQLRGQDATDLADLVLPDDQIQFGPLYRHPRKIWGIGLNYREHAADLSEQVPTAEPASFLKPDTTVIGHLDNIEIPLLSERTTGEAELGLVIGKKCRDLPREEWGSVLAGFTLVLDMTAEDILERNPRNLTQAKSFDTFFSFGPILYTLDEVDDIFSLEVKTILNGKIEAENLIMNMNFPLDFLVSYHSQIMTLLPGDIISTGTPGAVQLSQGDVLECRIGDHQPLINPVVDLKAT